LKHRAQTGEINKSIVVPSLSREFYALNASEEKLLNLLTRSLLIIKTKPIALVFLLFSPFLDDIYVVW